MKFTIMATAIAAACFTAAPAFADVLETYDLTATSVNGATINGVLTFDATTDSFVASSTYATVTGEPEKAAVWNKTYNIINNSAVQGTGDYLVLQNSDQGAGLYLQFNTDSQGGLTSLTTNSSIGYYQLHDHVVSSSIVSAVPEPETYALLLAGLGLVGAVVKRRKATPA